MIELREIDTARAMLKQTQVFTRMKAEDPERCNRLESLCSRTYFDAKCDCCAAAHLQQAALH
jgi:WD40 repeat-containing protein SMU1